MAVVGLVLASATVAGCGGAASQEALDSKPTAASSGGTSGNTTSGGTSGNTTSGGTSGNTTSGGVKDASADSPIGNCPAMEKEPNDDPDTANTLAPILCGNIQPNSESDFLTFHLQDKSTTMQLKFDGQVTLRVQVNGQTVTLGNGASPTVPFFRNKQYIIDVKAIDRGTSIPWRVELIEK